MKINRYHTLHNSYQAYVAELSAEGKAYFDEDLYKKLWLEYVDFAMDTIIVQADELVLPYYLGVIAIDKYKTTKKRVNYVETVRTGQTVYYPDAMGDQWVYTVKWYHRPIEDGIAKYRFGMVRQHKVRFKRDVLNGVRDYAQRNFKYKQ